MRDIAQRAAPLADRVASAVLGKATSDEIAILIGEAERTRRVAEEDHAAARARALDPVAGVDDASAAKREADDRHFELDRLGSALDALQSAHRDAKARETDARRRAAYDAAKGERDALVEELQEVYPEIERRLADLIGRVAANNDTLERINRSLPSGACWLSGAEEVARGGREKFDGYHEYAMHRPTRRLRLPCFKVDPRDPDAWPSRGRS
jgi:chromosome segregation ATPase